MIISIRSHHYNSLKERLQEIFLFAHADTKPFTQGRWAWDKHGLDPKEGKQTENIPWQDSSLFYYCIIVQWNFHNRIHLLFQMGASHTDTYRTRLSYVFTWLQCTFLVTSIITGNSLPPVLPKPIQLLMLQIKPLQTTIQAS